MDGFRDWLSGLSRRELVVLSVVAVAVMGAAGLWYARSLPRPVAVQAGATAPVPGPTPTVAAVYVHVAGWVEDPGVYELRSGQRVVDAIDLAGGPKKGADLDALNLAAVLVDGQQILVPRRGNDGSAPLGATAGPGAPGMKININSATPEELETLPGIGPVLAAAIIDHREENGPFTAVDELEDVSGIGPVTMEDVRDLVTV